MAERSVLDPRADTRLIDFVVDRVHVLAIVALAPDIRVADRSEPPVTVADWCVVTTTVYRVSAHRQHGVPIVLVIYN